MSGAWIITGCSTGIGRAIAETAVAAGHPVAVTARDPASVADIVARAPDRAVALALDVADQDSVDAAIAETRRRLGPIGVLVNNAGYGYVSSIEEGDEAEVRAMFEVNFWGALRMIQAVLPDMRAAHVGRIISITSLAGRLANPATGFYTASKYALEGLSETLSREVEALGIRVTAIAPGMFRSDFSGRSLKAESGRIGDYAHSAHARIELVKSADGRQQGDPAKLAQMVLTVAAMDAPPRQLIAGPDAYGALSARMDEIRAVMESNRDWSANTNFDG